jgi:hypothetical protein
MILADFSLSPSTTSCSSCRRGRQQIDGIVQRRLRRCLGRDRRTPAGSTPYSPTRSTVALKIHLLIIEDAID